MTDNSYGFAVIRITRALLSAQNATSLFGSVTGLHSRNSSVKRHLRGRLTCLGRPLRDCSCGLLGRELVAKKIVRWLRAGHRS